MHTAKVDPADFLLARYDELERDARKLPPSGLWSREFALADVKAKRMVVEQLASAERHGPSLDGFETELLGYLTQPFVFHPDYRREWAA